MDETKEIRFHEETELPPKRRTLSFSSHLLEEIYHSMDDDSLPSNGLFSQRDSPCVSPIRGKSTLIDLHGKGAAMGARSSGTSNSTEDSASSFCHIQDPSQKRTEAKSISLVTLRSSKIYQELLKSKQPTSRRGRISSFFNHVFSLRKDTTVGNRSCISYSTFKPKFSCLFKPPLPSVSEVPESFLTYSRRIIHREDPVQVTARNEENTKMLDKETKVCVEIAAGYLNYESGEEEDDCMSCASSQLFEIDLLIGDGNYKELPVSDSNHKQSMLDRRPLP